MSLHIELRVAAHLIGSPDYHSSVCLLRSNIFAKFSLSRPGIRKNICCRHTLFGEIAAKRSVLLCNIFVCNEHRLYDMMQFILRRDIDPKRMHFLQY